MDIILDTNLLLIYSRGTEVSEQIEKEYEIFKNQNRLMISVVTLGELNALTKKLGIGDSRKKRLEKTLERIAKINVNIKEVIDRYGDIDAYSQGKLSNRKVDFSSRNMGKNDIWIAATASVYKLKLYTTDKDFDHLAGEFIDLEFIDIEKYRR
ncbi:MAG: PIN domain-containing protein [bacterium]|jgi:predicted nucleic acid-binding protein|nr:PIN domain-containing protein [bacterium]